MLDKKQLNCNTYHIDHIASYFVLLCLISNCYLVVNCYNISRTDNILESHVRNILVPRVSGTQGNANVRNYIINSLRALDYFVELDEFIDSTPIGNVQFSNIIASSDVGACQQLVLACHYDSKLLDNFVGATDSAVPCAILLRMAANLKRAFDGNAKLGLRFVFFDGEEAFEHWTATDSLYGSRHLAEKWEFQIAPIRRSACSSSSSKQVTELKRIKLFVLLDLIGARDSSFVAFHANSRHYYNALQRLEVALLSSAENSLQQATTTAIDGRQAPSSSYGWPLDWLWPQKPSTTQATASLSNAFKNSYLPNANMQDDHVPFEARQVPILLLLSTPFPAVWHTSDDNYNAIDWRKTHRIATVLEQFVKQQFANASR